MIKRLCKLNDWLSLVKDLVAHRARRKHFSCRVRSVSQERKPSETESHRGLHIIYWVLRGWKYNIQGNNIFVKASIQDNNFSFKTYTGQGLF